MSCVILGDSYTANEFESVTKATIGQGAIVTSDAVTGKNSLASVNRDPFNTEIIIKDQQTAGLGVDANIDARVFTHDGRTQIIDEQKDIGKNTKIVGKITASSALQAVSTIGSFVQGDQSVSQAINSAKVPARMAAVVANNPNVGAVIQAYKEGDYDGLLKSQEALQILSDSTGLSTEVIITSLTEKLRAKGTTNSEIIAIDGHENNREDVIKTLGHEVSHDYGVKKEFLADLSGIAADLNVSASMDANQDRIDKYKALLGDGKDEVTQAENSLKLSQNNKKLMESYIKDPEAFDMSIHQIRTDNGKYLGSYETPENYMFNISQYLVNKHMHEKYPRAFDEDISKEEFAAIVLKSMEEVGVSDSIFKAFKNNGFYSGNLEIGEELGQQDNKDIIGTDENTEFHKQVFIRQIKENNIIEDEDYQRLEQDALLMRRLENSIGYEKFKQKTIGVIENYAVPTLYMVGGTVELVTAGGVEVVGCGTGFLCVPATVLAGGLVADGTDNIATGYYNWGKDFEEQTSSFVLTKVYGVSEEDANTIKLYAGFASMGGELGIAVNASRAANASPGLFIASRSPDASPELFVAIDKNQVVEKLDNLSQNASALNSIKPPVDDLPQSNTYNLLTTIDNPRPQMTVNPDEIIKGSVSLDAKGLFRSENGTPLNLTKNIIKDHNGYHRVFTAPTGVEVIDLPKGSNLVGEVQYMENIAPTLSTQNSGGVLSTIKTAFGFNKTNSSLPSGWEDLKDGTILTSSGSRVNRTEELYQVDGVTYEVFNNTSNGEKIIALPDGVELKGNGSFINKRDVSPSGSQNTDAVDSLSGVKADVPNQNNRNPEGYESGNIAGRINTPASQQTVDTLLSQVKSGKGKVTAYSKGSVGDNIIDGSDYDNFVIKEVSNKIIP